MALDGATPTMLGTSPLNRAFGPSVFTMCLKKERKNANWISKEEKYEVYLNGKLLTICLPLAVSKITIYYGRSP